MDGPAVIAVHALAAFLFAAAGAAQWRWRSPLLPQRPFLLATGTSALWAIGVAGIGPVDLPVVVAAGVRNLAWLLVLAALVPERHVARAGAFVVTGACIVLATVLGAVERVTVDPALFGAAVTTRMLALVGALVLAQRGERALAARGTRGDAAPDARHLVVATLALLWSADLLVALAAWIEGAWSPTAQVARGIAAVAAATLALVAVRRGTAVLAISRAVVLRAGLALGAALYVGALAAALGAIDLAAGSNARMVKAALVVATLTALVVLVATPWLRAWARVMVAKHFFRHRYDYRSAWLRFTEALGAPADDAPIALRALSATAELTESPAALLLRREGEALLPDAAWRWDEAPPSDAAAALLRHLERTGRVVDLDAVRAGTAPADEAATVPAWIRERADGWALAPLLHGGTLVGAILLARPPLARALDWEDFDLLGVAGRQVASYLAEERAHAALAEARRFEEFNRRFAFIGHDLKNLVSQLALVARNAERHAHNPAFRADMIATLSDSAGRMTQLLSRLSHHEAPATERAAVVPVLSLLERIADARRAQHPVIATGDAAALALVPPAALETVVGHLVQNAVEASAPGKAVRLAVAAEAGGVGVTVADRGCGMSAEFIAGELFRPFASGRPGGVGLGAHQARSMLEAMGGDMTIESRVGEGTTFRLRLPAAVTWEAAA